jgi:two-component system, chemotaxis family, chemotaxis protein CheY
MSIDKKQILIVDDDVIISRLLTIIFTENYNVVAKPNGIEAFRWLEEGNYPDLVISDMMMPYLDGSSFVKNLKNSGFYRDTPVVVLSGAENLNELIDEMPFKVEGYFKKPFNPAALKASISNILNQE